jgi:hypothetical protein
MTFDQKKGGSPPTQKTAPKMKEPVIEGPLLRADEVQVTLKYVKGGREIREDIIIPRSLIVAMTEPGESGMGAMEAMRQLAGFYNTKVKPELREMLIKGGISVPMAVISSKIHHAYETHALIAVTQKQTMEGLLLESGEVERKLRMAAALLQGVEMETIRKLDLEDTTMWVGPRRVVTAIERTPEIRMETQTIECECSSHTEYRERTLPARTTVSEARREREERLARMPKVREALDAVFGKIEELRGNPLDREERNAVVAYLNARFIERPEHRLVVTPSDGV